ncbi:MAG: hypothetical protein EBU01_05040, partial [Crocinitomicaceae bacterium]|nr:hypothetical protein [Crocinitomicaceae bacterium]
FFSQVSVTSVGTAFTQNFDGIGNSATASLPTGFRMGTDWSSGAATATTQSGGTSGTGVLASNSAGGFYNFANGVTASSTERAIGFLTSLSYSSPRSIIYAFTNNTGSTVNSINIHWNYEKYRSGSSSFDWTFFHGNTSTATTAATAGDQSYTADANNTTISNPPASVNKSFSLTGLSIANGTTYYLRWTLTGGPSNGQGLGIDDFIISLTSTANSLAAGGAGLINACGQGDRNDACSTNGTAGVNNNGFIDLSTIAFANTTSNFYVFPFANTQTQPYWTFYALAGTIIDFASATNNDAELNISQNGSDANIWRLDDDAPLTFTGYSVNTTSGAGDESASFICPVTATYRIRLTQNGCANFSTGTGTRALFIRVKHRPQTGITESYGSNQWNSYYYNGMDLNYLFGSLGTATWNNLNYNWSTNQPNNSAYSNGNMCSSDNFSSSHRMTYNFTKGIYTFTYSSDDGLRISTDGGTSWGIVNNWGTSTVSGSGNIALNGSANIRADQRENTGGASISVGIACNSAVVGTLSTASAANCGTVATTLTWSGGLGYYTLQSSPNGSNSWTDITSEATRTTTGAAATTFSVSPTATTYYRIAVSSCGSTSYSNTITITVNSVPTVSYSGSPFTLAISTAMTAVTPSTTNSPTTFSISPALPSGVSLNTSTGQISGTPTISSSATTYTITATTASNCSNTTTISLRVTPSNDLCANATVINVNASATTNSLSGSSIESPFSSKPDVWYKFTTPNCSVSHTITLSGLPDDKDLYIYTACGTTTSSWSSTAGGTTSEVITQTLAANTTYYIQVLDFANTGGNFTLSVTGTISLSAASISGTNPQTICSNSTGSVLTASGTNGGTLSYAWGKRASSGGAITSLGITTSTYTPTSGSLGTGTWYVVCTVTPTCGSAIITNEITINVPSNGDPNQFGSNTWNVYCYNAGDATGGSNAWNSSNYQGYYTISSLSFDTRQSQTYSTAQSWGDANSPSNASGYIGCSIGADNHSYIFKRQGFTCGTYQLNLPSHDDIVILLVDGVEVWRNVNCCATRTAVWTGYLGTSSTVELRISEGGGGSHGSLEFVLLNISATVTGTNPTDCGNGTITMSNVQNGYRPVFTSDFSSTPAGAALSGSAAVSGGELVLSTATNGLTGSAILTPSYTSNAWIANYSQYIGSGTGADGMSFSYGPISGAGSGEAGWSSGLVISFDTYNGSTNSQLNIYWNGSIISQSAVNVQNFRNASYVPVRIVVNTSNQLTVNWNTIDLLTNYALPAAYGSSNFSSWKFGFSARTGGLNDAHKVSDVYISTIGNLEFSTDGSTWATTNPISVTSSASGIAYTVQARPVQISCPNTNIGSTTITRPTTINYANLQFPASATICPTTGTLTVYGRVYKIGYTNTSSTAVANLEVQAGINSSNTNPNTWSTWSTASFNTNFGNDDEYQYTFSNLSSGSYFYAFRYRYCSDGAWNYGGYSAGGGGFWNGTTNVNGSLTVNSVFTSGTIASTGETICNGGTPSQIGSSVAASGGNNTITYSWRSSADSYTSAIIGATSATYTPPAGLTTTTSYRRYANDG